MCWLRHMSSFHTASGLHNNIQPTISPLQCTGAQQKQLLSQSKKVSAKSLLQTVEQDWSSDSKVSAPIYGAEQRMQQRMPCSKRRAADAEVEALLPPAYQPQPRPMGGHEEPQGHANRLRCSQLVVLALMFSE